MNHGTGVQQSRWYDLVAHCGEDARSWVAEYRRYENLADVSFDCLLLARQRRLDESSRALAVLEEQMHALDGVDPAICAVMQRWYHGVVAYHWYCCEAYEKAEQSMDSARDAVATAIDHRRFLMPLAYHCHEFHLQRARIARSQHRWHQVRGLVHELEMILTGNGPLCTLRDGTEIGIRQLRDYYMALPLSAAEYAGVQRIIDDDSRARYFARLKQEINRIPGFVLMYP